MKNLKNKEKTCGRLWDSRRCTMYHEYGVMSEDYRHRTLSQYTVRWEYNRRSTLRGVHWRDYDPIRYLTIPNRRHTMLKFLPKHSIRCKYKTTNNKAEYEALITGMNIAHSLGAKNLHVRSDSLLMVNQVNGDIQAKDSKTMTYLKIVKERIARFKIFSIEQIPHDQNVQADSLANLGSAFNEPTMESIPIIHLMTPTIEMKETVQMNEEIQSLETQSLKINKAIHHWTHPTMRDKQKSNEPSPPRNALWRMRKPFGRQKPR
ncbi:hypothetical protein OSB04_002395 [Centaurea solstitialis]|uniref:RNase H type-1 domain-containing protein n=1 Tax=Centaurea solstitialis TaxID=347529 RepID=A0AA38TTB6_9ASTR|nr:hypothetical protein OSB04_002395 [Centaurea solstitialis]